MTSFQLIRGSKRTPNTDVVSAALITVLEAHNAVLKADVEKLEAMLAAERESANTASRLRETSAEARGYGRGKCSTCVASAALVATLRRVKRLNCSFTETRRNVARGSQFYRLRRFLTLCTCVSRSNKANSVAARTSCFASR